MHSSEKLLTQKIPIYVLWGYGKEEGDHKNEKAVL